MAKDEKPVEKTESPKATEPTMRGRNGKMIPKSKYLEAVKRANIKTHK